MHYLSKNLPCDVRSPSPRPSPAGRGRIADSPSVKKKFPSPDKRGTIPPLPAGEGRGEGPVHGPNAHHKDVKAIQEREFGATTRELPSDRELFIVRDRPVVELSLNFLPGVVGQFI